MASAGEGSVEGSRQCTGGGIQEVQAAFVFAVVLDCELELGSMPEFMCRAFVEMLLLVFEIPWIGRRGAGRKEEPVVVVVRWRLVMHP